MNDDEFEQFVLKFGKDILLKLLEKKKRLHYRGINVANNRTAAGFYIGGTWSVDGNSPGRLENTFEGEMAARILSFV